MNNIILKFHKWETVFPIDNPIVLSGDYTYDGELYNIIEVRFTYTHNPAIGLGWCCFPKSSCLGYHKGDVESVFILFDRIDKSPKYVYFKAHGRGQGLWKPYEECEKINDVLVVYVARASHAFYPKARIWWRACIFASDLTSDNGRIISYNIKDINTDEKINTDIPNQSSDECDRCCLCFNLKNIRNRK